MRSGVFTALLGVFLVPLSDLVLAEGASLVIPRTLGLVLVAGGVLRLSIWLVGRARAPDQGKPNDRRANVGVAALSLFVLFLAVEGGANALLVLGDLRAPVREFRDRQTFASVQRKLAHPFLLLVNNPALDGVNELGFRDRDWPVDKPPGTIRIACLGASTTEDGYPERLDRELERRLPELRIEVLNFANGAWTTAQTLINYELNARHFSPDWIIVHHAANDRRSWGRGRARTDYSDSYRILAPPEPRPDAFLLRYFNGYALVKYAYYRARGIDPGLSVEQAIFNHSGEEGPPTGRDLELFLGNVREIAHVARTHGAGVVLTTQPYSRTDLSWSPYWVEGMAAANDGLRSLASELRAPLVDLDGVLGGRESSFRDPVHLRPDAVDLKVQALADALVPLLQSGTAGSGLNDG